MYSIGEMYSISCMAVVENGGERVRERERKGMRARETKDRS